MKVTDSLGLTATASAQAAIGLSSFPPDSYQISQGFQPFDSVDNSLTMSADLTIVAPYSYTYKPQLTVSVRTPNGSVIPFNNGSLMDAPWTFTTPQPPVGQWTLTVGYYFTDRSNPAVSPIHVDQRVSYGFVSATPSPGVPVIEGQSSVLWWWNGQSSGSDNPNQIQLRATNVSSTPCTWSVTQGGAHISLVPGQVDTCKALVDSVSVSDFENEIKIVVEDGQHTQSDPFPLTVDTPYKSEFDYQLSPFPFQADGWKTYIYYHSLSKFGAFLGGEYTTERFGTPTPAPVPNPGPGENNWIVPTAGSWLIQPDGQWWDTIDIWGAGWIPLQVSPGDPNAEEHVRDIPQEWFVDPTQFAHAVRVMTDTQAWYLGDARHLNVVSPAP